MNLLNDLRQSVIDGDMHVAQELVLKTLAENIPPEQILKDGLISAMTEVGRMFEAGEFFVPEMLISTACDEKRTGNPAPVSDCRACAIGGQGCYWHGAGRFA